MNARYQRFTGLAPALRKAGWHVGYYRFRAANEEETVAGLAYAFGVTLSPYGAQGLDELITELHEGLAWPTVVLIVNQPVSDTHRKVLSRLMDWVTSDRQSEYEDAADVVRDHRSAADTHARHGIAAVAPHAAWEWSQRVQAGRLGTVVRSSSYRPADPPLSLAISEVARRPPVTMAEPHATVRGAYWPVSRSTTQFRSLRRMVA
jgi:hypothetical protein